MVMGSEVAVEGKMVSVPGVWIAQYPSVAAVAADDAGATVEAVAANGRKVWECYVLGVPGARAVIMGAAVLGGEWHSVTDENKAALRFFKMVVELP